jgi:hypothetical protein
MNNVFTEEQAINITIKHGYNGEEFQTSVWKNRKCLKPNRTLEALISKLQTIYNNVEVEGKGKKRKYILTDKKDQVTEREYNYKGTVPTIEDDIMKEYIFNKLLKFNGYNHSYKGWALLLEFPDTEQMKTEELIKVIKEIHFEYQYHAKEVISRFLQNINIRNKDIIEKSFQRLAKENRINVSESYIFKTVKNEFEEVDQIIYEEAQQGLKQFLESKEINLYIYNQSLTSLYRTDKMKRIIKEAKEYLVDHFGIEYFFKSMKVVILDQPTKEVITNEKFNEAYYNKFVKLAKDRQDRKDYNNSLSFWRRFYLLNTLSLLEYIGINNFNDILQEEKKNKSDKLEAYSIDMLIYYDEQQKEKEKRRNTFGKIE